MRAIAFILVLASCGAEPLFDESCDSVKCRRGAEATTIDSGGYAAFSCSWECVEWDGRPGQNLTITWHRAGGCWDRASETAADGDC